MVLTIVSVSHFLFLNTLRKTLKSNDETFISVLLQKNQDDNLYQSYLFLNPRLNSKPIRCPTCLGQKLTLDSYRTMLALYSRLR
jgi:hypothetical protein